MSANDLHAAARSCDLDAAGRLLGAGVEVDARGPQGRTPLMEACWYGHLPMCELLLAAGANACARASEGGEGAYDFGARARAELSREEREAADRLLRRYGAPPRRERTLQYYVHVEHSAADTDGLKLTLLTSFLRDFSFGPLWNPTKGGAPLFGRIALLDSEVAAVREKLSGLVGLHSITAAELING